jgi:uncharacterized protein YoxC
MAAPLTTESTVSATLALSKIAWKLGVSLSKLYQDTNIVDTTVEYLAGDVKSLSVQFDLVYAQSESIVSKENAASPPRHIVDGRMWDCLTSQVGEIGETIQELEAFVKNFVEELSFTSQGQLQGKLENSKDQIASLRRKVCAHTDGLRITLLMTNT